MRIAVIGCGYVGLVAGACFAELGHDVLLVDDDFTKIAALNRGEVPIFERHLPELLNRHRGARLLFTNDTSTAVMYSDAIFIAVGTPPTCNGEADLSYVESVARTVAGAVNEYKLVVDKSTVPVYTSEWVRKVMLLNGARNGSFDVASNPEFLREGTAVTDFLYPDRIVIGCNNERSKQLLRSVYEPLTSGAYYCRSDRIPEPDRYPNPAPLIATSTRSAELIKHASNAFLAMKISFINAVANVCEAVGADVEEVRHGIGTDARIGSRFLYPGIGYGGSCFPKDVAAFNAVAQAHAYRFGILAEVMAINEDQRQRFLRKVRSALWTLKGKQIAVLGLSFKDGTDDVRESPAIAIVQDLVAEGCCVMSYDPAAMARAAEVLPKQVRFADSPYAAARNADALLILTEWQEFKSLDLARLRECLRYPIVIDGRNLFLPRDMEAYGFSYWSIGRPSVIPHQHAEFLSATQTAGKAA